MRLKYEQEAYQDLLRNHPQGGGPGLHPGGQGHCHRAEPFNPQAHHPLDKDPDGAPKVFKVSEVKVLRDGKIKVGKKSWEELKQLEES